MYIANTVSNLIDRYKTRDPFDLCSYLNIIILWHPLGEIRGYYMHYRRGKFIILSTNLQDYEKPIVCSHELGHAVMHPNLSTPFYQANTLLSKDKFERQANQFAAELLIPDDLIYKYEGFTRRQIAYAEGVNEELLKLKFEKYL
ncbi:MAG: ImmA/IrrE family metallo-endopeptidase [Firmicutes bacterium]|nr:ImmA/IrrE family metallo-endopeptidase [Bacillota bacterium]